MKHLRWAIVAASIIAALPSAGRAQQRMIPNVVGKDVKLAINALAPTNLPVVTTNVKSTAPVGTVTAQHPSAGTPVSRAHAETLLVAGPRVNIGAIAGTVVGAVAKPSGTESTTVVTGTTVPDLYGASLTQVLAALERSHLKLGDTASVHSDLVPAGDVFRQSPQRGSSAKLSSPVAVWFSLGSAPTKVPPSIKVPPLTGMTIAQARDVLAKFRLQLGRVDQEARPGANGTIDHQEPHAGTDVHAGDGVDVTIAVAPRQIPVPDVVGKPLGVAKSMIEKAGLVVGSVTLVSIADRDTVVLKQTPMQKKQVDIGTSVILVANGPKVVQTVVVPDLRGLTDDEARHRLEQDSLKRGVVAMLNDFQPATVVDQQPPAGATARVGTSVDFRLQGSQPPGQPAPPTSTQQTDTLLRVPDVVRLALEQARTRLGDSGFVNIEAATPGATAASVVDSQFPTAGTRVRRTATVQLFSTIVALRQVPELRGMREDDARRTAAQDAYDVNVRATIRGLRLFTIVAGQSPTPADSGTSVKSIDVDLAIPVLPPLPTVLGVGALALVAGSVRHWRGKNGDRDYLTGDVHMELNTPKTRVALSIDGRSSPNPMPDSTQSLVKASVVFEFGVESGPWRLSAAKDNIIKPEEPRHA